MKIEKLISILTEINQKSGNVDVFVDASDFVVDAKIQYDVRNPSKGIQKNVCVQLWSDDVLFRKGEK